MFFIVVLGALYIAFVALTVWAKRSKTKWSCLVLPLPLISVILSQILSVDLLQSVEMRSGAAMPLSSSWLSSWLFGEQYVEPSQYLAWIRAFHWVALASVIFFLIALIVEAVIDKARAS